MAVVDPAPAPEPEPEPAPEPATISGRPSEEFLPIAIPRFEGDRAGSVFERLRARDEARPSPSPSPNPSPSPSRSRRRRRPGRSSTATPRSAPVEKDLGRRLKRVLADEQNDVLDKLRRMKPKGIDDLLPDADAHVGQWAETSVAVLYEAAAAGALWMGGKTGPTTELADELARSMVLPLRERIERSFVASDGNLDDVADRVRALYREWKNQKLGEAIAHHAAAAYAQGMVDAMAEGSRMRWVVDPSRGPCPDCDDNVLAGVITKGEEFPTGNRGAPAHPGCRCLVLLAGT